MRKRKSNWWLAALLLIAFFLRVYRTGDLLGFYYDQGRDALVIWDLWHKGKLFLIGPVTGLEGVFLGPFFYYLIAPFYLIGQGNPVVPAIFLALSSTLAIYVVYLFSMEAHSKTAGTVAVLITALSYNLVLASRWLSNPTPILLTSILLLFSMWKIMTSKKNSKWWIASAFLIGVSLHFEAASAAFYIPMFVAFSIWQRKKLPGRKHILISIGVFLATLLPQIIFNFRHNNILVNNFTKILFSEGRFSFWQMLGKRMGFFWEVYHSKIIPGQPLLVFVFSALSFWALIKSRKKVNKFISLLIVFLGIPAIGYILFQGNNGSLYDYYMTGYYLPLILLFSLGLAELWKLRSGKVIVALFFSVFIVQNHLFLDNYFHARKGHTTIVFENQLKAVDWVFEDAQDEEEFNVDVYVPPVIPHTYDYLFLWQGTLRQTWGMIKEKQVPVLYTLYEEDPPHPERLEVWLERQEGIGTIEEEINFGGITVQRRLRI